LDLRQLNQLNTNFWLRKSSEFEATLEDLVLANHVYKLAMSEFERGLTLHQVRSYEIIAEEEQMFKQALAAQGAKKAGRAKKANKLSKFILSEVAKNPELTALELRRILVKEAESGDSWLDLNDDEDFEFFSDTGQRKIAKNSGLDNRLTKAKKDLRNRDSVNPTS
jgi:uncharacterized protein YihD (DUF1040 family)